MLDGGPIINEIHYDNAGGDVGEFVEIRVPAGTELGDYTVTLYNGANGNSYATLNLGTGPAVDSGDGFAYVVVFRSPIQNGSPDGLSLNNVATGEVCEFLSYEGTFTANNGPAAGTMSTDIGVSQDADPIGSSLQRLPDGTWQAFEGTNTQGMVNECFLEGTQIKTTRGATTVENLQVGDTVITADGEEVAIKWIGYQELAATDRSESYYPVRISAGTVADGIPSSDLYVSPDHALLIDNLLINAGALINDVNITQIQPQADFRYFHIELDKHAIVLAEDMPAESYLPQREDRETFDNADSYPGGAKVMLWPLDYARIAARYKVPAGIYNSLVARGETNKAQTA